MIIASKDNPQIKKIASLQSKKYRKIYSEFLVEGIKAVDECIKSGFSVLSVYCTEALSERYKGSQIVSEEVFSKISTEKSPQGVIAVVKMPEQSLVRPKGNCILLDRLQDPGNVGTIIRTANAAGYDDVYLADCADAFSPKAIRASMGGVFYVALHVGSLSDILKTLCNVPIICADMNGEDMFGYEPPSRFCLCIGNEGQGVCDELLATATKTVKIGMRDTCESLNAAVSAAIAMYVLKNNQKGEK